MKLYEKKQNKYYIQLKIWISFVIVIILQITYLKIQNYFSTYKISLINLFLIYWLSTEPNKINIGNSFLIGLITDIMFYSILGTHALSFSILSYLITVKFQNFKKMHYIKQIIIITLLFLITEFIISYNKLLYIKTKTFNINTIQLLIECIINNILWICIQKIMNKLHNKK
ncbi:Rod shape-determining protein mreD [Candidatus Westeberhardia cardiocondylae]|uniref:Rod shape-determining protein mreD n=1 Tax=Candidatus Westeberhardia cardiocondylae TaxID=1594731 RepID=A0A0H5BX41_9ENTR|nr:rod shape-determining protein MreD [Candidatus Westeberhardia cardiocondylae]CEN32307.1 Rod shape-determining protein mreD [Candidatus Westeberhardia cardiocondylae]